ncbi:MAG TPA: hypothetical protein VJ739_00425, partial [Gemmataceae bacterium]|nr:hypothetical protein [Gemmataceae bacterium]
PVASWWLAGFGWPGLVAFKLATVALVAALAVAVSRRCPRAGGRVLTFGCGAVLAVVLYSGLLVGGSAAADEPAADEVGRAEQSRRRLDHDLAEVHGYWAQLEGVRDDLLARRCTLGEGAEALTRSDYVRDSRWMRGMTYRFPGRSERECLAARLIEEALHVQAAAPDGYEELARDLDAQYRSCFGRPPPRLRTR